MIRSILLVVITVFLFSGCHRYNHNIHARIIPTIIISHLLFRGYERNYHRQQHHNHHRRGRHRNRYR
jgi:fumarate reductase subunit D